MSTITSSASNYALFQSLVRAAPLTGQRDVLNDVSRNTHIAARMIKNRPKHEVLRTGGYIVDKVWLTHQRMTQNYTPGDPTTSGRTQSANTLRWDWAFCRTEYSLTDADTILSQGDMKTAFKSVDNWIKNAAHYDHLLHIDNSMFAQPNSALMNAAGMATNGQKRAPYSIPAYVSENTTTYLPPSTAWSDSHICGSDGFVPGTETNARNKIQTYIASTKSDPENGVFAAFRKARRSIKFEAPKGLGAEGAFEGDMLERLMIITNADGMTVYENLQFEGQDHFRGGMNPQDPAYTNPNFYGVPLLEASVIDEVQLDESAGAYTSQAYPAGSPRYFMINGNYMFPVFHQDRFMYDQTVAAPGQPDTQQFFRTTWWQLICRSRRRHAIIKPAA